MKPATFHIIQPNSHPETCASCTNTCCDRVPGALHPDQLETVNVNTIEALFLSGMWVADWWDGWMGRAQSPYFIRPRQTEEGIDGFQFGAWGGPSEGTCSLLNDSGCSLPFAERPFVCQALIPNKEEPGFCCEMTHEDDTEKEAMVKAWVPYQRSVRAALRRMEKEAGR